MSTKPSLGQC